jgi:hypothetical protein
MAPLCQGKLSRHNRRTGNFSSTSPSCCWTSLACMRTAPSFLRHTPPCLPICKSSLAIIWWGCGSTSTPRSWATLAVYFATPSFLPHAPTCLPIGETISAIVRVCWARWWCSWQNKWRHGYWWQSKGWHSNGWHGERNCKWQCIRRRRWQFWATTMMYFATPNRLGCNPRVFSSDGAIERVACRCSRACWCNWKRWRQSWRESLEWCWRLSWI